MVGAASRPHFTIQSISAVDVPSDVGEGDVRITATVVADERDDHAIEAALANVITAKPVTAVRCSAEDLSGID